jgi:hypothetical protein
MRCPKCDAIAADSDPCCLWCGKRLNHSRSAPSVLTPGSFPGGPPGAGGLRFDQVGLAVGMVGVFAGMVVATGPHPDVVKSLIAAVVCVFVPLLCVALGTAPRQTQVSPPPGRACSSAAAAPAD